MTETRRVNRKAARVGLQLPRYQQVPGTDGGRSLTMGWQLVREAEDHGPDSLTWRERFALSVLANAAMDSTRECPHGMEDNPDIVRRLRLGRSERYSVIASLCDKGALIQVERGRNGVRAVYAIAPFATLAYLMGPGNPDPSPVDNRLKGPGFPDASPVDNAPKGPGNPDASEGGAMLKGPGFTSEGSGFDPLKGPGFPDPIGDRRDYEETRPITHARAREAVRLAFPGLNDQEIDETIRIVKVRFHPKDMTKYVRVLIDNGDLAALIPCGLSGEKHSERCRNRDCANCKSSWCEGRCHNRNAAGAWSA
jgi:hypothetical protein